MKEININSLTKTINQKTLLFTDKKNVNYLKKEMFNLNLHHLVKVTDIKTYVKKSGDRPISSMLQKMYFFKALSNSKISNYCSELLSDVVKTYKEEYSHLLEVINETDNYKLYKKVLDLYKSYNVYDYEQAVMNTIKNFRFSSDIIIYDINPTRVEEKLLEIITSTSKNAYSLVIEQNNTQYIQYQGTDLYNEVLFAANQIASINDLNNTCIVANKIDSYIPFIDLIFKENEIPYNSSSNINISFVESLIANINKKNTHLNLKNQSKELFLKNFYSLIENADDSTHDFLVSFIDAYDTVYEELNIEAFTDLLAIFKSQVVNVNMLGAVDIINLEELTKEYKYVFMLGVNRGEMSSNGYNNLFIKYSELNYIYSNYNFSYTIKNHEKNITNMLTSAPFIFLSSNKVNNNNSASEPDELLEKIDFQKKYNMLDTECFSYLKKSFQKNINIIDPIKLDITKTSLLKLNHTSLNLSPSKLDTYNKCPFSYYCNYLLDIKEEYVEFDNRHIGSYVHLLFEKAIESNDFINDFKKIEEEYKAKFNSPIIKFLLEKITENIIILYPLVKKELDDNNFNVEYKEVNLKEQPLVLNIDSLEIKISGIIDRVDEKNGAIRIVDYKTGNKEINLNEMLIGINLQLFIYMLYYKQKYGKKVSGIFYQRALINIDKEKSHLLDGLILDNEVDNYGGDNIGEYINVVSRGNLNDKKVLNSQKFELLSNYTVKKIKDAATSMMSGNINISPIDKVCDYCPYQVVCGIEKNSKKIRYIVREEDVFKKMEDEINGIY